MSLISKSARVLANHRGRLSLSFFTYPVCLSNRVSASCSTRYTERN